MEPKVIVIVGPTCSGKTRLGLHIAELAECQIISADSRQIYKYLDIGTAKPIASELSRIKHHFINKLNPDEEYSSSKFEKDALAVIRKLTEKKIIPIVIGGSGLYIKALIDGIFDTADADSEIRQQIMEERREFGNQYIYEKLKEIDPKSASEMLPQNWKRVIRALEVFRLTGKPIWMHQKKYKRDKEFNFLQFGLKWEREILYRNIEARVDQMFDSGLIGEVEKLLNSGYDAQMNSLNTVGYKEVVDYLYGNTSLERCRELIKRNTRRYAKRQMTWFRRDERIKWFEIIEDENIPEIAMSIFNEI